MVIQHNLAAMNANRQFKINTDKTRKIAEKLSSGYKINRSADDAAGLAMSEKMRRQIRGLGQAAENIQEGIGYVQTAEGALNEVHDMLQRMNELAVKSANGTNTEQDREYIDAEVQQLKSELDRVFETTSFNERLIWEPKPEDRVQIGTEKKQAVTYTGSDYKTIDATNANCGVVAYGGYKINASEADGVSISWTGFNGTEYETTKISWDELKEKDYSFDMSDYFDPADTELFDSNGNPLFGRQLSFNVEETATVADIVTCINDRTLYSYPRADMNAGFQTSTGTSESRAVTVYDSGLVYSAAYASNASGATDAHDFDAADDAFIEPISGSTNLTSKPSATTVADARTCNEGWEFTFDMAGIGTVKAQSTSISYYGNDRTDDDEGLWWRWYSYTSNGTVHRYKDSIKQPAGATLDGTLAGVMSALTGDKNDSTPGLLNKNLGADSSGYADSGGYILLHFDVNAENAYTYADGQTSKDVGSFTLKINVSNTDTEQDVLDRINDSLDNTAILDFATGSGSSSYGYTEIGYPGVNSHQIDVPIWGGMCKFHVQAGTEAGQRIEIQYEALSNIFLELEDVDVLDVAGCDDAINRIKSAMIEVSKQRSDFGAYQNRLEKSYNVNKNTQENTQYSESRIRDTDMAKTMVEYSNHNVLLQAGQAILSQMNNYNQGVLQLLQ